MCVSQRRVRRVFQIFLAALSALLFPLAAAHLQAQDICSGTSSDGEITLEVLVHSPVEGEFVAVGPPCPDTIPVTGIASALGIPPTFDVYLLLDMSGSTGSCTGSDIDGDGITGTSVSRGTCTDRDDNIYQAEVEAAARLVEKLDLANSRVGIMLFSDANSHNDFNPATVKDEYAIGFELPLTDDPILIEQAIEQLRRRNPFGATDFQGPQIYAGCRFVGCTGLGIDGIGNPDRDHVILFLSDGAPTLPVGSPATTEKGDTDAAFAAADQLSDWGVTEHTYAVGAGAAVTTLRKMASRTGGRFFDIRQAGAIVDILPSSVLTGVGFVAVRNLTLGESIIAELGTNGEFHVDLPVTQGWNDIEVIAESFPRGILQIDCPVSMFLACGRGCEPNTQGFWHRQCLASEDIRPGNGSPDLALHVEEFEGLKRIVDSLLAEFGQSTCDGMDASPPSDPCERALKQYTAFLLNIAEGRLGSACELDEDLLTSLRPLGQSAPDSVDQLRSLLEDLLREGLAGDTDRCKEVNDLADAVNRGAAVTGETVEASSVGLIVQPMLAPINDSETMEPEFPQPMRNNRSRRLRR